MTALAATGGGTHAWHALGAVVTIVIALGGVAIGEQLKTRRTKPRTSSRPTPALVAACVASMAGAASVHVVVMPAHFAEAPLYGAFFAVTAGVQIVYAVGLGLRPSPRLLRAGLLVNASLVALWLASRLVAVPLGPAAGQREAFGALDIIASSFETCFVLAALALLRSYPRDRSARAAALPAPRRDHGVSPHLSR